MLSADRDAMVESYYYLCSRAARKFIRDGIERADLEQIAAIGLIKAVDRFDAEHGTPFEAYAWVLILGELMHYVRDTERLLRAPRRVRDLERRWCEAERALWMRLERNPSPAEIAEMLDVSAEEAVEVRRYQDAQVIVSMDAMPSYERHAPSYTIEGSIDRLPAFLESNVLSDVERTILREIYERDTPIFEVSRRLGYSRRHIARLHRAALQKLSPLMRPLSA